MSVVRVDGRGSALITVARAFLPSRRWSARTAKAAQKLFARLHRFLAWTLRLRRSELPTRRGSAMQNSLIASKIPPSKKSTQGTAAARLRMPDAFVLAPGRLVAVPRSRGLVLRTTLPARCSIGFHGRPTAAVRAESACNNDCGPAAGSIGVHGQQTAAVRAESLNVRGTVTGFDRIRAVA